MSLGPCAYVLLALCVVCMCVRVCGGHLCMCASVVYAALTWPCACRGACPPAQSDSLCTHVARVGAAVATMTDAVAMRMRMRMQQPFIALLLPPWQMLLLCVCVCNNLLLRCYQPVSTGCLSCTVAPVSCHVLQEASEETIKRVAKLKKVGNETRLREKKQRSHTKGSRKVSKFD